MKIKTITCHDVYNAGASLQAYALATYLQNIGHEVEIINYKPEYLSKQYRLWGGVSTKYNKILIRTIYQLVKFPGRLSRRLGKRKRMYDSFTQKYLPMTEKKYISNKDLKNNLPEADIYFAGSDQIWNTFFNNGRDPAFYLEFVPNTKIKASYAASFATEDIIKEWQPRVTSWLHNLDYISVRESSGKSILEKLGFSNVTTVLDPVFLLKKEQWDKMIVPYSFKEDYILVYDFDENKYVENFARMMARKNNWKIYSIFKCKYGDKCFESEGPEMFLNLIKNAAFVISNSFHATAFSLIYHKEFIVFKREEGINTRMSDLVECVGLTERIITNNQSCSVHPIDYHKIQERIDIELNKSKQYISKVLRGNSAVL